MNGTLASPAVALASRVFPVPGGPVRMAPYAHTEKSKCIEMVSELPLLDCQKFALLTVQNAFSQTDTHLGDLGTKILVLFGVL